MSPPLLYLASNQSYRGVLTCVPMAFCLPPPFLELVTDSGCFLFSSLLFCGSKALSHPSHTSPLPLWGVWPLLFDGRSFLA